MTKFIGAMMRLVAIFKVTGWGSKFFNVGKCTLVDPVAATENDGLDNARAEIG